MTSLFIYATVLGVAYCATPGAVNAESIRRGLARGFWPSARVQLGSLIGDASWAVVALVGVAYLAQNHVAGLVLGVVGVAFLARLTVSALQEAWRGSEPSGAADGLRGDFATGAVLSLANPWGLTFWLGIGGAVAAGGAADPRTSDFALFLAGFMLGALLWCLTIASLVGWGRRFVGGTFFRWVNLACGLALAYFTVRLALSVVPAIAAVL